MKTNLFPIAKEGWLYLAYLAPLILITSLFDLEFLSFILFVTLIATAYMFRNPERALPIFENASVISPVDGVVKSIEELNDSKYAYKIEIESSYSDVAILRSPMNARVEEMQEYKGTRVAKSSKLFNDTNERVEIIFVDNANSCMKVVHVLKQSFSSLSTELLVSQNLHQTSRYGLMLNGVTTLYLPHNFRVNVNIGNELKAAESLIGYFS